MKAKATGGSLSIASIQNDPLISLAAKHWGPFSTSDKKSFDAAIVTQTYERELLHSGFQRRKIAVLEFSQYLEAYLWPFYDESNSSDAHVLSIVVMVNEKFRERIPPWNAFVSTPDRFSAFFERALRLLVDDDAEEGHIGLSYLEQTALLTFLVNAVNSIEIDIVRREITKITSLAVFINLQPSQRTAILSKNVKLLKVWNKLESKFAELPDAEKAPHDFARRFLWRLIQKYLVVLASPNAPTDPNALHFLERFLELTTDMLSLLTTRRFFNQLVVHSHLVIHSTQSELINYSLFGKLVDRLTFYVRFEIDDSAGEALNENTVMQRHYDHVVELQKAAFKFFRDTMASFYLSSVSAIDTPKQLREQLGALKLDDVYNFAEFLHIVPTREEMGEKKIDETFTKAFLVEAIVFHCERRPNQLQKLNEQPIMPNEKTIWDEDLLPYEDFESDSVLALPKLNIQFLTLHDYLFRNFNLFQMESIHMIRHDLENVLYRMRPWKHETNKDQVVWGGWARMALPLTELRFVHVGRPLIGQRAPSEVTADLTITLPDRRDLRAEWENLHRHEVLFLVSVIPKLNVGQPFDPRKPFNHQLEVAAVRGCEIEGLLDAEGKVVEEMEHREALRAMTGDLRRYRVFMDPFQYFHDQADGKLDVNYQLNLVIRRDAKTNNFKAILATIRQLLNTEFVVPDWLQDLILGYGEPDSAHFSKLASPIATLDFNDTFLSIEHLKASFPEKKVKINDEETLAKIRKPGFRLTFQDLVPQHDVPEADRDDSIIVEAYERWQPPRVILQGEPRSNKVPFTPAQVEAVKSGTEPGLTMVVGPPGTGKTDVAVQIIANIYHNWPEQRTLIVTHSNQALNQLFEKIIALDVDERHLLRLGHGEEALETEKDFSRYGRVNYVLQHRLELLREVDALKTSLGEVGDVGYSCETAGQFYRFVVCRVWEEFLEKLASISEPSSDYVLKNFPFLKYFETKEGLFTGTDFSADLEAAKACWRAITDKFAKLEEFRAFELLRNGRDRTEYLLVKEAKIIAMTCTHAALRRKDLVDYGFRYDNILMEESAQILEVETFIPLLLQDPKDGRSRLKRWIMIGDHNQLPPVVQNATIQKYSNMEQSLFTRFIRLGVPHTQLDAQGRARPEISALYNWRYKNLRDLEVVKVDEYASQNPGFAFNYQLIDIPDFRGVGESTPSPYFYQNLGEAEYAVALFIYMRVLGYPAEKISILTTYNGQVSLINDVLSKKCANNPLIGRPHKVSTVDRFQGQQNDYIILSLVRTNFVGHLRDIRRLVVALSRARLGLYILGRVGLFANCFELAPAFTQLCRRPTTLHIVPNELFDAPRRSAQDSLPMEPVVIADSDHMIRFSHEFYTQNMAFITERFQAQEAERRAREAIEAEKRRAAAAILAEAMEVDRQTEEQQRLSEQQKAGKEAAAAAAAAKKKKTEEAEGGEAPIVFESVEFERLEHMPTY